ncbi:hypothetical protein F8S13_13790 [Chloroflexia bacterium SDU3-3]|nr:hypothetical protein F8S13_13790 [Chloroflexia bacterium SDU3-3]
MPKNATKNKLESARVTLGNIDEDEELRTILAAAGYAAPELAHGHTLYDTVQQLIIASNAAQGAKLSATKEVVALRDLVEDQAKMLAQMARTIFASDAEALETLGLRKKAADRSQAAFLAHARLLYDGALGSPKILDALAKVGYPKERVEACRAKLAELEQADIAQEKRKSEAEQHSAAQNAALDELEGWLQRLRGVGRSALAGRKDLLKKINP